QQYVCQRRIRPHSSGRLEPGRAVSEVPYASRSQMSYLAAVRRSVTVFCSDVKLPGILAALLASALIAFSVEQAASTEKWIASSRSSNLNIEGDSTVLPGSCNSKRPANNGAFSSSGTGRDTGRIRQKKGI